MWYSLPVFKAAVAANVFLWYNYLAAFKNIENANYDLFFLVFVLIDFINLKYNFPFKVQLNYQKALKLLNI